MKRAISILAILCLILALFAGCASKKSEDAQTEQSTDTAKKTYTIGFSYGWSWVPYSIATKLGAEQAAQEEGVNLIMTSADCDMTTQLSDIENMMQKDIDALLEFPIDSAGLVPITQEAMDKGLPVGTVDVGFTDLKVNFHVASDNYGIGQIAAKYVGDYLGDKGGKVAIIGWSTATATSQREAGFKDTIAKDYPKIEIVAYYGDGGTDRTAALNAAENILQANPDVNLIWGSNEQAALGALAAVDAANVDVPIVGVDSDVESLTALSDNPRFLGTVSQDPYQMGYTSVKTMVALLNGESVESNIVTETQMVTKDNVADFLKKEQHYQDVYQSGNY